MRNLQRNAAFVSAALAIVVFGIFLTPPRHPAAQITPQARIFVISDEELREHFMHYKAEEAFRETIHVHYPGWAALPSS